MVKNMLTIPGLTYIPDYLNNDQHKCLLDLIDLQIWATDLKRRVQHYGYQYNYQKRSLNSSSYLGALPDWIMNIAVQLYRDGLTNNIPNQVIINEYQPGQGIAPHIDCIPCFGDIIISLSLGSHCVMDFSHGKTKQKLSILLLPGSLIILEGEARYKWQHGISRRQKDNYEGNILVRQRRVSMTFREVISMAAVKAVT